MVKVGGRTRAGRALIGLAALLVIPALDGCLTAGSGVRGVPSPAGNVAVVKSVLEPVLAVRDFQPLFDRLADDVLLRATVSGGVNVGREFRGKRKVMAFFLIEEGIGGFVQAGPLEYSGDGDRVVVRGVRGRESAAVVDFRDGRIIRFLVILEG